MVIALELNHQNVIIGYVYIVNGDYTNLMANEGNRFTLANINNLEDIIEYKTKYEDGKLIQLEDYIQEYYNTKNIEEQKQEIQEQLQGLYLWFDAYDMQIKQYDRDIRMGVAGTYHINDNEYTIVQLDTLATQHAIEINQLKQQLNELNK